MRVAVVRDGALTPEQLVAVRKAALPSLLRCSGADLGLPPRASLALLLTGDRELRRLNATFLDEDAPTDVLAFPAGETGRVGDIAISVERALAQAADGVAELRLLAVHGLLHCSGHDHADAAGAVAMTAATRRLLPGQLIPDLRAGPAA